MEKQKAIRILRRYVGAIEPLKHKKYSSPEFTKWLRNTEIAIERIFGGDSRHFIDFEDTAFSKRYPNLPGGDGINGPSLDRASMILESGIDEIKEFWPDEDKPIAKTKKVATSGSSDSRKIFIVHGHDNEAKQTVARFIEKLKLKPIILHEKPNEGRTIIEKFEKHSDVGFAVVLMTPDDVGALAKDKDNLKPRARQNVILELGFFLGKLGRKRVCALYKENVEIPSDYKGVLFIPMDKNNGWQLQLAKEIKAAGIDIDLNKAI